MKNMMKSIFRWEWWQLVPAIICCVCFYFIKDWALFVFVMIIIGGVIVPVLRGLVINLTILNDAVTNPEALTRLQGETELYNVLRIWALDNKRSGQASDLLNFLKENHIEKLWNGSIDDFDWQNGSFTIQAFNYGQMPTPYVAIDVKNGRVSDCQNKTRFQPVMNI